MNPGCRRKNALLSLAIAATFALPVARDARADEAEVLNWLTKPESGVSAGVGYLSGAGRHFGQYSGVNERGYYGLLDLSVIRRDDPTGTWLSLQGWNLGLENREVRFDHGRQGSWGYSIGFDQIPRYEPYVINTRLIGVDSGNQVINGAASARDVEFSTRRDSLRIGAEKILPGGFDVQVDFRNEEKTGSQLFGQGFFGPINFLANPIDYTTRQLDVVLNYTGERLQLSGGYYATDFTNHIAAIGVTGGIAGLSPMALPPGNQSHQANLSGGYNFTPSTRGTFKMAYTHQTQNEGFVTPSSVGRSDLGGVVDTTLLQAALTSRPALKLSLLASIRFEDRDDKTPVAPYLTAGILGTSTLDGTNERASVRATTGKLEATYDLPAATRLTGGYHYDQRARERYRVHSVGIRDHTDEHAFRVELRRPMYDTLTGSLSLTHADRRGSSFATNVLNDNSPGSNLVHPLQIADRKRDKVRLTMNWQPVAALTFGFYGDYAKDEYGGRVLGPREGKATMLSVDAAYVLSKQWQLSAWASRNDVRADQSTCVTASAAGVCPGTVVAPLWSAGLRNTGDSVGIALRGKPLASLEVGADGSFSHDSSEYRLTTQTAGATAASIPDSYFRVARVNLFAKYGWRKDSDVRVSYNYERWTTDDWTWNAWTYSDGTRVMQDPRQTVHFIGVAYSYRWQ
jgi:MtrB/PioB family decaheme-associated outer membrane protein